MTNSHTTWNKANSTLLLLLLSDIWTNYMYPKIQKKKIKTWTTLYTPLRWRWSKGDERRHFQWVPINTDFMKKEKYSLWYSSYKQLWLSCIRTNKLKFLACLRRNGTRWTCTAWYFRGPVNWSNHLQRMLSWRVCLARTKCLLASKSTWFSVKIYS